MFLYGRGDREELAQVESHLPAHSLSGGALRRESGCIYRSLCARRCSSGFQRRNPAAAWSATDGLRTRGAALRAPQATGQSSTVFVGGGTPRFRVISASVASSARHFRDLHEPRSRSRQIPSGDPRRAWAPRSQPVSMERRASIRASSRDWAAFTPPAARPRHSRWRGRTASGVCRST